MTRSPWQREEPENTEELAIGDGGEERHVSERLIGMTFNMPESWHRRYKMRAVQEGTSMRGLLIKIFDEYEHNNP